MKIEISSNVKASLAEVWEKYTSEEHIVNWNFANDEWHCPSSNNDLTVGGRFSHRMEAKDGSFGFSFDGEYTLVDEMRAISYRLDDGRDVFISFSGDGELTRVKIDFEPEDQNPHDMQKEGWQAILNSFKKYAEQ